MANQQLPLKIRIDDLDDQQLFKKVMIDRPAAALQNDAKVCMASDRSTVTQKSNVNFEMMPRY